MASIFMSLDGPWRRDASLLVIEQDRHHERWRTCIEKGLVGAPLSSSGFTRLVGRWMCSNSCTTSEGRTMFMLHASGLQLELNMANVGTKS